MRGVESTLPCYGHFSCDFIAVVGNYTTSSPIVILHNTPYRRTGITPIRGTLFPDVWVVSDEIMQPLSVKSMCVHCLHIWSEIFVQPLSAEAANVCHCLHVRSPFPRLSCTLSFTQPFYGFAWGAFAIMLMGRVRDFVEFVLYSLSCYKLLTLRAFESKTACIIVGAVPPLL